MHIWLICAIDCAALLNRSIAEQSTDHVAINWSWTPAACDVDRSFSFCQWWREGEGGRHFAGAAFEGQKFRNLEFALQCVSVSLYLLLICSLQWGCVLPVGWAAPQTFAPLPRTSTGCGEGAAVWACGAPIAHDRACANGRLLHARPIAERLVSGPIAAQRDWPIAHVGQRYFV